MIKLYHTEKGILLEKENQLYLSDKDWDALINSGHLYEHLEALCEDLPASTDYRELLDTALKAPVKSQEVWACGVTYFNSKLARQEESKKAGGGIYYEKVYHADRPELFFKSTPQRVVGSGEAVRIREDSSWDVPEPELTLVINSMGKIVGYTIGNDMSSRSIEGENPLYLAQAKIYDGSAAVGPCVLVTSKPLDMNNNISLEVVRKGKTVFEESISMSQMKRTPEELVTYLFRETSFPQGCLLMTGTGIVPTSDFSLRSGDEIRISIETIGTLINVVA